MKAAICYEFGKPLVIEDVTIDPPKKDQVRVRVAAAAICHSDIHSLRGEHGPAKLPAVAGHEVSGYVEEVGADVTYVKPGDAVVCCLVKAGCGQCYSCIIGQPHLCEKFHFEFKQPGAYLTKKGERPTQLAGPLAGFVEYTNVPEQCLVKIPKEMPMDRAALIGCGVISGFFAIVNGAKVKPFQSVLVMGAGGVGLNAVQGAAFVGAHPIIALDTLESKLEAAKAFGATHTINVTKDADPVKTVREFTHGRGADYVIITVAGIAPKRQGFSMLSGNGMEVLIGHGTDEFLSSWDAVEFVGGRMMTGCAMGATRIRVDMPNLIELYQMGRLKLDELISGHYPLERINEAIESSLNGGALRNVIMF